MIEIIRDIVEDLTIAGSSPYEAPLFAHGEQSWLNLIADEAQRDVVYLDEPIRSSDIVTQGGYMEEVYTVKLFFGERTQLDYTPEQHQEAIKRQREQRRKFLNRAQYKINDTIKRIDRISTLDAKNVFDLNLSGVIVTFDLVPLNNYSSCP